MLVAVPTMLLALLMFFTTRETPRGAAEQALASQFDHSAEFAYSERLSLDKFYRMWRIPTNQVVFAQVRSAWVEREVRAHRYQDSSPSPVPLFM